MAQSINFQINKVANSVNNNYKSPEKSSNLTPENREIGINSNQFNEIVVNSQVQNHAAIFQFGSQYLSNRPQDSAGKNLSSQSFHSDRKDYKNTDDDSRRRWSKTDDYETKAKRPISTKEMENPRENLEGISTNFKNRSSRNLHEINGMNRRSYMSDSNDPTPGFLLESSRSRYRPSHLYEPKSRDTVPVSGVMRPPMNRNTYSDRVPEHISEPRHSEYPVRRVYFRKTRRQSNTEQIFMPSRNLIEDNAVNIRSDMTDFHDRVPEYLSEPRRSRASFRRVSFKETRSQENSEQRFSLNGLKTPSKNLIEGNGMNIRP